MQCNSLTRLFFHCFTLICRDSKNDWRKLAYLTKYICWRTSRLERILYFPFGSSNSWRWVRNIHLFFSEKSNQNWMHAQKDKIFDRKLHGTRSPITNQPPTTNPPPQNPWGWKKMGVKMKLIFGNMMLSNLFFIVCLAKAYTTYWKYYCKCLLYFHAFIMLWFSVKKKVN